MFRILFVGANIEYSFFRYNSFSGYLDLLEFFILYATCQSVFQFPDLPV